MSPTPAAAKLQVGSCHGKINYDPFETVFDGSKVRRDKKQAAQEVRESLRSRRLVDSRSWKHRPPWTSSTENEHRYENRCRYENRSIYSPMKNGEVSKRRLEERSRGIKSLSRFNTTSSREFSAHNRAFKESRRAPLWNTSTGLHQDNGQCTIADKTQSLPLLAPVKKSPNLKDYRSPVERQKEFAATIRRQQELQSEKDVFEPRQPITLADVKDPAQEEKLNSDYRPENLERFIVEQEAKLKGQHTTSSKSKGKMSKEDRPTFKPVTNDNIPLPSHTHVTSEHRGAWAYNAVEGCNVWSCCLSHVKARAPGCSVRKTVFRRIS